MNNELQLKLQETAAQWGGNPAWGEGWRLRGERKGWGCHRTGTGLAPCRERGWIGVKAATGDSEARLRGQAEKCGGTPPDPDLSEAETPCCGARGVTGRKAQSVLLAAPQGCPVKAQGRSLLTVFC